MFSKKCVFWVLSFCLLSISINTHGMEQEEGSTGPKSEGQQEEQATEYKITNSPSTVTAAATYQSMKFRTVFVTIVLTQEQNVDAISLNIKNIFLNHEYSIQESVFQYTPEQKEHTSTVGVELSLKDLIASRKPGDKLDLNNNTSLTLMQDVYVKHIPSTPQRYIFIISVPRNVPLNLFTVTDVAKEIERGMDWLINRAIEKKEGSSSATGNESGIHITNSDNPQNAAMTVSYDKNTLVTIILTYKSIFDLKDALIEALAKTKSYYLSSLEYTPLKQELDTIPLSIKSLLSFDDSNSDTIILEQNSGQLKKNTDFKKLKVQGLGEVVISENLFTKKTTMELQPYSHYIFVINVYSDTALKDFTITDVTPEQIINKVHVDYINTGNMSWIRKKWLQWRGYNGYSLYWTPPVNWNAYFNQTSSWLKKYALYGAGLVGAAGTVYTIYRGPKQAAQDAKKLIDQGKQLLKQKVPAAVARGKELIAKGYKLLKGKQ